MPVSYQPEQKLIDSLQAYDFSKRLTSYRCKTCGSKMLCRCWVDAENHNKDATWDVMCGTLEKADGVYEYLAHEQIEDTLDGGFANFLPSIHGKDLPRWPQTPDKNVLEPRADQVLPLDWKATDRPNVQPSPTDRLHCHCKCNGVEFWIARPSEKSKNAANHLNKSGPDAAWWLMDDGKKFLAGVCACDSCRLDSGQEWLEWAFVPTVDISLDAEGEKPWNLPFGSLKGWGTLKGYMSTKAEEQSGSVVRYHCGTCGASVFFTSDARTDHIDVAVGLMDAPEGARAESWLEFWTHRLSYGEDSIRRNESVTHALETGLKEFGQRHGLAAKQAELEKSLLHQK
ncbi:uncharacterized protein LTR77_005759 [Saxophila tyrrhenica]|uniref:CENP-V/GFA domain-containing protein n=1 Tax=Saxophila tyrrhenica TaxID=1690608 RepID=A0AAV9P9M6_9PEZI|nr:hypothetical protein LTR77_005759 [Saxophila tyrrhenica]